MSFNSFQSPHTGRPNPTSHETNHNTNSYAYYQPNFQKTQTYKTSDQTTNLNTPSINSNYLNVPSNFNQQKNPPYQAQRKHDAWKSSEMTSRSMVFMGNQTQTVPLFPIKKRFSGLGKLSQMARTVSDHSDEDLNAHKLPTQSVTLNNSQDKDNLSFKNYGNHLAPDSANFRNNYEKAPSTASSMIFNPNEQRTNVYKSFINYSSNNNSGTDAKNNGNLDFLLKFKKQQEEKKYRDLNSLKVIDEKRHQVTKSTDNSHRNLLCPPENNHHHLFHQYSAPKSAHGQKNHHYEPVLIHNLPKTEEKTHKLHNQIDSSPYSKNSQHTHAYTPNHPFIKKLYPEKLDRYVPQKTFNSELQLPAQKEESSPTLQGLAFAKKETKVAAQSATSTSQNTPIKDKFISAAFFKHRQNKLFSEAKTVETTPSPPSVKGKQFYEGQSPKHVKSIISEDGSSRSEQYIDNDVSSEEQKEWCLRDFQLGDKLGKGAFGDVYIAREIKLGFMCVLKKMSKKRIKDLKREEHVIRQLKIQMYLNHKHLTAMYGYFHDNENIYLVLEYLSDGNLSQIKKRKKTSQKETAGILKQLCQGLSFMHKHNIIHRDIKPQNIFVNEGNMKLGDFGCSVFTDAMRKTVVSCLEYSSPEQLNGECYNQKIDVWGIGILTYQLLTGRSPYEKELMNMGCEQIDFSALKFPEQLKLSALAKDFIKSLLNVDPIDRIDIEEALEHKFITSNYQEPAALSHD